MGLLGKNTTETRHEQQNFAIWKRCLSSICDYKLKFDSRNVSLAKNYSIYTPPVSIRAKLHSSRYNRVIVLAQWIQYTPPPSTLPLVAMADIDSTVRTTTA